MKNLLLVNCSPVKNGATAFVVEYAERCLHDRFRTRSICIDDYQFRFCQGCRSCHTTAQCVVSDDDIRVAMAEFEWADVIICVSPSYWSDIPGQFKAFIDRCTPWCNTHEPHASIGTGKIGYVIALRTGPSMRECNRIIDSIEHFYSHLEISPRSSLGLPSVEFKNDAESKALEIRRFCEEIIQQIENPEN